MEKISGIIPSSARVTAVDHSESNATRPGAPNFGAPKGVSSLAKPDRFTKSKVVSNITDTFMNSAWKKRDLAKAGLVEKMSDVFFQSKVKSGGPSEVYIVALPVVEGGSDSARSAISNVSATAIEEVPTADESPVSFNVAQESYSAKAEATPMQESKSTYLNIAG